MKGLVLSSLLFILPIFSYGNCPVPKLQDEFILNERIISLTTTLDLEDDNGKFGTIKEKLISLARSFTYTGPSNETIATAKQKLFSWGVQIDVFDCARKKIGTIKENILKSMFKTYTTYSIEDASGEIVAISKKVSWLATSFSLKTPEGKDIAKMKRPVINFFGDKWKMQIENHKQVDPRLYIMIAAYKTSADNQRSSD